MKDYDVMNRNEQMAALLEKADEIIALMEKILNSLDK